MKKRIAKKRSTKPSYLKWGLLVLGLYLAVSLVTVSGPFSFFATPADINQVGGKKGGKTVTTTTTTARSPRMPSSATITPANGGSGGNQTTGGTTGGTGGGSGINANGASGGNQTTGITPANGGSGGNQTTGGTTGGTGGSGANPQTPWEQIVSTVTNMFNPTTPLAPPTQSGLEKYQTSERDSAPVVRTGGNLGGTANPPATTLTPIVPQPNPIPPGPTSCDPGYTLVKRDKDKPSECVKNTTGLQCGNVGFLLNGICYWPGSIIPNSDMEVCDWTVPGNNTGRNYPFLSNDCPKATQGPAIPRGKDACGSAGGWWNPANNRCYMPNDTVEGSDLIVCDVREHTYALLRLPAECPAYLDSLPPEIIDPSDENIPNTCPQPGWTFVPKLKMCVAPLPPCQATISPDRHTLTSCGPDNKPIIKTCSAGEFNDVGVCLYYDNLDTDQPTSPEERNEAGGPSGAGNNPEPCKALNDFLGLCERPEGTDNNPDDSNPFVTGVPSDERDEQSGSGGTSECTELGESMGNCVTTGGRTVEDATNDPDSREVESPAADRVPEPTPIEIFAEWITELFNKLTEFADPTPITPITPPNPDRKP